MYCASSTGAYIIKQHVNLISFVLSAAVHLKRLPTGLLVSSHAVGRNNFQEKNANERECSSCLEHEETDSNSKTQ